MAQVVHDIFRSEDSGATGGRNSAKHVNSLDFQECGDTCLQCTGLDLETWGFNEYANGINARSIILEVGGDETITGSKGDPITEIKNYFDNSHPSPTFPISYSINKLLCIHFIYIKISLFWTKMLKNISKMDNLKSFQWCHVY